MAGLDNKRPCYQCPDRQIGCHGHCKDYMRFKTEYELHKNEIETLRKQNNTYIPNKKRRMKER